MNTELNSRSNPQNVSPGLSPESNLVVGEVYVPLSAAGTTEKPWDAYVRVSRVGKRAGSESFISPGQQVAALKQWADRTKTPILLQPFDLDVSGGTMNRPTMDVIRRRIEAGLSGGLVVYKIDRFSRSLMDALPLIEHFIEKGAGLASCTEEVSYRTPPEKLAFQMLMAVHEHTRTTLKEGWAITAETTIARGVHICNNVPVGYSRGPDKRLVPNEFAPAVVETFRRRALGAGWNQLATYLDTAAPLFVMNREGELWQGDLDEDGGLLLPDKDADDRRYALQPFVLSNLSDEELRRSRRAFWTTSRVEKLLKKRVYLGHAFYGKHSNLNAHHPLVTQTEFAAAAAAVGSSFPTRPGKVPNLLQGLLRCASCRYLLQEGTMRGERAYRCNRRSAHGPCPSPVKVNAELIETAISATVSKQFSKLQAEVLTDDRGLTDALSELNEAQLGFDALLNDLETQRTLQRAGKLSRLMNKHAAAVEDARRNVEAERLKANATLAGPFEDWSFDFSDWWDGAGQMARKGALAACVDTIFVRGAKDEDLAARVRVLWRGEGPSNLPRRSKNNGAITGYSW